MAYPRECVVPVPELGDGATITLLNPWMLPAVPPLPLGIEGEELRDAIDKIARDRLVKMVLAWNITDYEGHPLPLPKDDPSVYDRCPNVVHAKVLQAFRAMKENAGWDPTTPEEPAETTGSPTKNAPSENSTETFTE